MKIFVGGLFSAFLATGCFGADAVEITQKASGKSLAVEVAAVGNEAVKFRLNGEDFTVPLGSLTEESVGRLRAWEKESAKAGAAVSEKINAVVGEPLFGTAGSLWNEKADDVAKRLRWRKESATDGSSSYRSYPGADYGFLNARPHCCTLYGGEGGTVSHFSIVFANKGDFGSTAGRGEDHFKSVGLPAEEAGSLDEAIERDAKAIGLVLTKELGEPKEQRYGEKEDRREVKRWDYGGHAFILSEREGEYAHLLIVPVEVADEEGRIKFVKDQDLRTILEANVVREKNGDVRIKNIPMVDQGPKGYCAPATFERAMRYMLVPADMYLLATLATAPGGGTYTGLLAEESKRIIRSKARRIKDLNLDKDLDIREVAKYIDKGVPILWQMASLEEYNAIANRRTADRGKVEDFDKWTTEIEAEAEKVVPTLNAESNHHICMIVGYNDKTKELAVSDSWGPAYELRWVRVEIAQAITLSGGFVVDL